MQENCEDLFGIGEYKKGYINTLNLRSSEYSDYEFSKTGSNYSIYLHLAKKIQDAMGLSQTNKWVMDQIVDIDAVEICKKFPNYKVVALEHFMNYGSANMFMYRSVYSFKNIAKMNNFYYIKPISRDKYKKLLAGAFFDSLSINFGFSFIVFLKGKAPGLTQFTLIL